MRFDLKRPCENCPFRSDDDGIRFYDTIRALGIYLTAAHHGFPCHKSAVTKDRGDGEEGFVFRENGKTQHCAGALILLIKEGHIWTEGTGKDRELFNRLRDTLDLDAPVFPDVQAFLTANERPAG